MERALGARRTSLIRRARIAVVLILAACSGTDSTTSGDPVAVNTEAPWIGELFADAGAIGTFAAREVGTDETIVHDLDRAAAARLPASTFKILNSLIILETGVLSSVDEVVAWDGVMRDIDVWNRDHTLRTGIEVSAVWMYQQLAREVGSERMRSLVRAAGYGNADAGPVIDDFWLRGDLRISPLEQLDFLERLATGDLPFDAEHVDAVRDILVRESGAGWVWSHKTGTASAEEPVLGWLVGLATHDDTTWVFALNLDLETVGDDGVVGQIDPQLRLQLAREILVELGALGPSGS